MGLKDHGLGAKEGVLLHLLTYNRYKDEFSCPKDATQPGISAHLGIDRSYISYLLSNLIEEKVVFEKTTHVQGEHRMKKVYFLTDSGFLQAKELSERTYSKRITFSYEGETQERPILDAAQMSGLGPLDLVLAIDPQASGDLETVKETLKPAQEPVTTQKPTTIPMQKTPIPQVKNFVGRREEIRTCDTWLGSNSPMLLICGIAGQGKTALCSEITQRWEAKGVHFIYTRLTSWGTQTSFFGDVAVALKGMSRPMLAELISEKGNLGWEEFLSVMVQENRAKPFCLIVDDLHEQRDPESTRKLIDALVQLGHGGLKSIVCSREDPQLYDPRKHVLSDNITRMRLGGLSRQDVEQYLILEGIKTQEDVFALTKGHPLFLNLYMHFYKQKGANEAQRSIREFIRGEALSRLGPEQRNLLDILTEVRGGATESMLLDLDSKGLYFTQEAVIRLKDSNILMEQDGVLVLHELVREVCIEGLDANRKRDIHTLLFEHYNERFEEFYPPKKLEFEQVQRKIHLMKEMLHHHSFFAPLSQRVALLTELGEEMTSVAETDDVLRFSEDILRQLDNNGKHCTVEQEVTPEGRVNILILNGWCNSVKGEQVKANDAYTKALDLASECNLDDLQGRCLNALGTIHLRSGELEKAKQHFELAIKMLRRPLDLSKAQSNLGVVYWQRGELDRALGLMESTLALSQAEGDVMGLSRALTNKGIILWQMGRYEDSLEMYWQALEICTKNRFTQTLSMLYDNIGEVYLSMGDVGQAYGHFRTSLMLAEELGFRWQMAQAKKDLAMLTTDAMERQKLLREALEIYKQIGASAESEKLLSLLQKDASKGTSAKR